MAASMKRSAAGSSSPSIPQVYKKIKQTDDEQHKDGAGDDQWTVVERRKSKSKTKKTFTRNDAKHPRFMYSNPDIIKRKHAVGIDDIRDLVLHLVADAAPPNWLRIENPASIQKLIVLLIPGLTSSLLSLPPLPTSATANPNVPLSIPLPAPGEPGPALSFVSSTFSHACPTRAPGDKTRMHSVLGAFFQGPVSANEKAKRVQQRDASGRSRDKDPRRYMLTLEQMIENEYPIPSYMADVFEKPEGWVETPPPTPEPFLSVGDGKTTPTIYAIDCEMCLTEDGNELARICIIDYNSGIVVYDCLVKPAKPVLDYLTRWSGITASALENVTTSLPEIQLHLLKLLTPSSGEAPILLGHSLESDLRALKLCHPRCVDTALVYHHPRGRPLKPGLAWLAKKWCGREIQMRGDGGHDPEEDARACVELLRKKVESGPAFGEYKMDHESIFERMTRSSSTSSTPVRSAVVDHGNPGVMHGSKATTAIGCTSDEDILKGLLNVLPSHDFVFGRFTGLADVMGWTTPKRDSTFSSSTPLVLPPTTYSDSDPATITPILQQLDTHLTELHEALPPRTGLVIFTGHDDPRKMADLNARKLVFDKIVKAKQGNAASGGEGEGGGEGGGASILEGVPRELWWTASEARQLEEQVELAKRGLLFLAVKT